MEDDDEIQSHPSPAANGRIAVTVAAAPPVTPSSNGLTLALPIPNQKTPGSGGGREDCWSEDATAVLIDAWGERYMELRRGNLKQNHWKEVADIVCSREDYGKTPKTDIQCKNRIDTVKKYKVEKAKNAAGAGPSKWRFFDKLDELIGPSAKTTPPPPPADTNNMYQRVPMGIPVGVRSNSHQKPSRKRPAIDSDEESEPENSGDSSDGLPPESYKRPMMMLQRESRMVNNGGAVRSGNGSGSKEDYRSMTRAILKLGEAYEQAEMAKLQQMVEMEKQRMKFAKELELQRMQHFMKTQMELLQLKNRRAEGNNNDGNNNNNSDSSN